MPAIATISDDSATGTIEVINDLAGDGLVYMSRHCRAYRSHP